MGRWNQRRRASSNGPSTSSPTPNPVTIVAVVGNGTSWTVRFDRPVAINLVSDASNFLIGDASFFTADGVAGTDVDGTDDNSSGFVPGLAWFLTGQPDWLVDAIAGPQSGTTV